MADEVQPVNVPETPDSSWSRKMIIGALSIVLLCTVGAGIAGMLFGKEPPDQLWNMATLILGILAAIVSPSKK